MLLLLMRYQHPRNETSSIATTVPEQTPDEAASLPLPPAPEASEEEFVESQWRLEDD